MVKAIATILHILVICMLVSDNESDNRYFGNLNIEKTDGFEPRINRCPCFC